MQKYRNKKVTIDGITFDSTKEANRYAELKLLERAGAIKDLQIQPRFTLIPSQKRKSGTTERAVDYVADFFYRENGNMVVEDVKSPATRTPQYIIKRKLMLFMRGIEVKEI